MKRKHNYLLLILILISSSVYSQKDNKGNEIILTCDTVSRKQFDKIVKRSFYSFRRKDTFSTKELLKFIRIASTIESKLKNNNRKKYRRFMHIYGSKIVSLVVKDESMDYVEQMGSVRYSLRYKMFISKPGKSHTMLCHNYFLIKE